MPLLGTHSVAFPTKGLRKVRVIQHSVNRAIMDPTADIVRFVGNATEGVPYRVKPRNELLRNHVVERVQQTIDFGRRIRVD